MSSSLETKCRLEPDMDDKGKPITAFDRHRLTPSRKESEILLRNNNDDDANSSNNSDAKVQASKELSGNKQTKTIGSHAMDGSRSKRTGLNKHDGCKKLSFHDEDEDMDEDSNLDENEASNNFKRLTKSKWELDNTGDSSEIEPAKRHHRILSNGFSKEQINYRSKSSKSKLFRTKAKAASQQDDVVSTSSCSCEDHNSAEGHSEHLHEDLDYDEDSITGSDSKGDDPNNKQNEQVNGANPSSSGGGGCGSSSSISSGSSDRASNTRDTTNQATDMLSTEVVSLEDDIQVSPKHNADQERTRIKSFINRNRTNTEDNIGLEKSSKIEKDEEIGNEDNKAEKSYESLLKYFFKDACYFQIKSINHENVELAKSMGVWSTSNQNEVRLNAAFREHRNVILIFSVQHSGAFQGFARMVSESKKTSRPIPWLLPERLSNKSLGGVIKIEWLCSKELPFHATHELFNPYNDNKPVKVARDGQQVESSIGKKLCKLFPHDSEKNLLKYLSTLKHQTSQRKKSNHKQTNFYPFIAEARIPGSNMFEDLRFRGTPPPLAPPYPLPSDGYHHHREAAHMMTYNHSNLPLNYHPARPRRYDEFSRRAGFTHNQHHHQPHRRAPASHRPGPYAMGAGAFPDQQHTSQYRGDVGPNSYSTFNRAMVHSHPQANQPFARANHHSYIHDSMVSRSNDANNRYHPYARSNFRR